MESNESIPQFSLEDLAAQLRRPSGEAGLTVGHNMHESNIAMTRDAFDAVPLKYGDHILELGHGNGHHLKEVLTKAQGLHYTGLDISELMSEAASAFCTTEQVPAQYAFEVYDGLNIPYEAERFDKVVTVNTLYFWTDPTFLLQELYRVLKPGGFCSVAFVDKASMDQLPFTEFGFTKYDRPDFENLARETLFMLPIFREARETVRNKMGQEMERDYFVALLQKPL